MSAGVGKTYRMLDEAHQLLKDGVDVKIAYVETHERAETVAMLGNLPLIPRKTVFYKGKELEEMDLESTLQIHPEVVIVDELPHSNIEGSRNQKRWQDVYEILDAGINVISAMNIQHIESLAEEVESICGLTIREKVPDHVLKDADEVVNLDLTVEELLARLKSGKIYHKSKIQTALNNFFKTENILQLRELALKQVASCVEHKVEVEVQAPMSGRRERILACISSNELTPRAIIRKAYRLSTRYNTGFTTLYVRTSRESPQRIKLSTQRHLLKHFELAAELGGNVRTAVSDDVVGEIIKTCRELNITTLCMGQPNLKFPGYLSSVRKYRLLLRELSKMNIDLIILSNSGN